MPPCPPRDVCYAHRRQLGQFQARLPDQSGGASRRLERVSIWTDWSRHSWWAVGSLIRGAPAGLSGLRGTNATAGNPAGTREALFVLRKLPDGKETGTDETLGVFFWQTKHQNGKKDKRAKETRNKQTRPPSSRFPSSPVCFCVHFLNRGRAEAHWGSEVLPCGHRAPPIPNTPAVSPHKLGVVKEQPRETSTRLQNPWCLRRTRSGSTLPPPGPRNRRAVTCFTEKSNRELYARLGREAGPQVAAALGRATGGSQAGTVSSAGAGVSA